MPDYYYDYERMRRLYEEYKRQAFKRPNIESVYNKFVNADVEPTRTVSVVPNEWAQYTTYLNWNNLTQDYLNALNSYNTQNNSIESDTNNP